MIGGRSIVLGGYWDAGYVTYDLSDPFAPKYISDSDIRGSGPARPGMDVPEGNGHYAEFSHDNRYMLAADEDFRPHRGGTFEITTGADAGEFDSTGSAAVPRRRSCPICRMNGPTVYGGYGCDASAPIPQRVTAGLPPSSRARRRSSCCSAGRHRIRTTRRRRASPARRPRTPRRRLATPSC